MRFLLLALLIPTLGQASAMKDLISHLSHVSTVNEAGSFQDQSSGHYSAGGIVMRQRNRTVQPLNIRLPHLGGSCGNFDIRFGGMSFLKAEEFKRMLQATAQGVPSYGLQLALKTISPQIEGLMSSLRKHLQDINAMMLNDCRLRQQVLEGVLPTGSALHEQVCHDMQADGLGDDYTGARERCQKPQNRDRALQEAQKKHEDLLVGEFNLVWQVLKKMPAYKEDPDKKHRLLSLVGTVLSKKEGPHYKVIFIEPKADEVGFLEAHLRGGETTHYGCTDLEKCLDLQERPLHIEADQSLGALVLKNIAALQAKYLAEEIFTPSEIGFLSDAVNLPIYKYIQVSSASGRQWPLLRSAHYIALSILLKQFEDVAAEVLQAVNLLEAGQFDTKITTAFKDRLERVRSRLQAKLAATDSKEIFMLDKIIRTTETELKAKTDLERTF